MPGTRREQALEIAALTLADAYAATQTGPFGGLHGGSIRATRRGTLILRRDELVRGAPVSGRVGERGTLHVGGRLDADVAFRQGHRPRVRLR